MFRLAPFFVVALGTMMAVSAANRAEGEQNRWQIGLARVQITPEGPIPMCGYSPLERGEPLPGHYRAAISLWQFGDDLTLVGLPGEAVAGYVRLLQTALGSERLWIAAYTNESFGYLPTATILAEGGHESMCLTLAAGFFAPTVEDVVVATVQRIARQAGRREQMGCPSMNG